MKEHPLSPLYIESLIYCFTYMEIQYLREGSKCVIEYTAWTQNSLDRFGSREVLYRIWHRMRYVISLIIRIVGTAINQTNNLKHGYPVGLSPGRQG